MRLHGEYSVRYGNAAPANCARESFWSLLPPRTYLQAEAQAYLKMYAETIEQRLAQILQKQSIAYWYHVYRRLGIGAIGADTSLATIAYTHAILDAAIQKYGTTELCDRIANSANIEVGQIFGGEPTGRERSFIEQAVSQCPSLVLVKFSVDELAELYLCESLAYELWRTSAMLRMTGKGCGINVFPGFPWCGDARDSELNALAMSYDERCISTDPFGTQETHSGTVFSNELSDGGMTVCYILNVQQNRPVFGPHLLKQQFGVTLELTGPAGRATAFSYQVIPLNLRAYLETHRPLEDAFEELHKLRLEDVIAVLSAIGHLPLCAALDGDPFRILRPEMRGYDGAYTISFIHEWVVGHISASSRQLGCTKQPDSESVLRILQWLSLSESQRQNIDLIYPGPHSIFLPIFESSSREQEFFVDYAWVYRRLRDLFFGVSITDNNFKGTALERVVQTAHAPLQSGQLFASDGSSKQVDASFALGDRLLIAECRASSRSIGFEKGQPTAVEQRRSKIDVTLKDVDGKASWLANHPIGRNYDVSGFREVIGVGVMPFVEFIPSRFEWYWLRPGVPRVLTPDELKREITRGISGVDYFNGFKIGSSDC